MISAATAIELTTRLSGLCAALLAAETLLDHRHYGDHGLLGWPVMRSRHRALVASWYAPTIGALLRFRVFMCLMTVRLACGLALAAVAPSGLWGVGLLLIAAAAGLLFQLRSAFGLDGADQMNELALLALCLDALCGSELVRAAVLWFLALQLALSYFIAGVAKLRGVEWRAGRAPWEIFATQMYGARRFGLWLKRRPRLSWSMSWLVIVLESTFPIVFVAPRPVAIVIMLYGLAFHAFNAVVMGLNTFFWAFASIYPALVWCVLRGA